MRLRAVERSSDMYLFALTGCRPTLILVLKTIHFDTHFAPNFGSFGVSSQRGGAGRPLRAAVHGAHGGLLGGARRRRGGLLEGLQVLGHSRLAHLRAGPGVLVAVRAVGELGVL